MNAQAINKTAEKSNLKANTAKPGADQEKAINQLRQEIRTLSKAVKEMQQKPDTQAFIVTIPHKQLHEVNAYLSDYERNTGSTMTLSEFICEGIFYLLLGEEENKRLEEEQRVELEKQKKK